MRRPLRCATAELGGLIALNSFEPSRVHSGLQVSSSRGYVVMDLYELDRRMQNFVHDHGWTNETSPKPQTPKNLAISIVLEAAELLECFQWTEEFSRERVADELADVLLYAVRLAGAAHIDLAAAVEKKLETNVIRQWD